MSSVSTTEEFEPHPNDEDYEERFLPMEIHHEYGLVFRYYTREERAKREQRYKEMERLMGPQPQRPRPIMDDAEYALYECEIPRAPEAQTLEVDPSLKERELGPIVLTPEEEEFYNGPKDLVLEKEGFDNKLVVPDQGLVASSSNSKVPTPLLDAKLKALQDKARGHVTPQLEPNPGGISQADIGLSANLFKYVLWRITDLAQARLNPGPDPLRSKGPGRRIECEENFRFKPGDILQFLEVRTNNEGARPWRVSSYVNVHKDTNYFEDYGQYRQNFMDTYGPLFDGDMVFRFGNFNKQYHWRKHGTINFYVYYTNVKPLETSGSTSLNPWYWVEPLRFPVKVDHYTMSVGIGEPRADQHMPIGTIIPYFRLRDGDILMTYVWDLIEPRFDRMRTFVWNPLLENIGVSKFVKDQDRVLRYGMRYEDLPCTNGLGERVTIPVVEIEAELYSFRDNATYDKQWVFLGRSSHKFMDHLLHGDQRIDKVKRLYQVPIAGDILFDRGLRFTLNSDPRIREGPPWRWFRGLNIGGLVKFHIWELLKDYGLESRPYVRHTDVGRYGVGDTTMALRFGNFKDPRGAPESSTWTWQDRYTIELFVLNTRGSSWRRAAIQVWPHDLPRPKPNYFWEPNDIHDITGVSSSFEPRPGDIIIRLDMNHDWISQKANPLLVGNTYNPHYDVKIQMGIFGVDISGLRQRDFLVRAGYEKNEINPAWTNATVELYYHEGEENSPLPWKFWGRDANIFGTNYWKGGLDGVQQSGFGDLRVNDIEKLNSFDRTEFVRLDPSEIWKERSLYQALKDD